MTVQFALTNIASSTAVCMLKGYLRLKVNISTQAKVSSREWVLFMTKALINVKKVIPILR